MPDGTTGSHSVARTVAGRIRDVDRIHVGAFRVSEAIERVSAILA